MNKNIMLQGGSIIDGAGSEVIKEGTVVVRGKEIIYVGEKTEAPSTEGEIIDVSGKTVLPGLIDAHTHLTFPGTISIEAGLLNVSLPSLTLRTSVFARRTFEAGFTTIREVGAIGYIDIYLRDAINEGLIIGPRILASGKGLTQTGGHGCIPRIPSWIKSDVGLYGQPADGVDEVIKATRQQIEIGADCIKFWASGGAYDITGKMGSQEFSEEEMRAIVLEAHRAGRLVTAHAIAPNSLKTAVKAGVDGVEHVPFVDSEAISLMRDNKVFICATLSGYYRMSHGAEEGVAQYVVENTSKVFEAQMEMVAKAKEAGIDVITGTDAGSPLIRHGENALELELLTKAGYTEMEAIMSSTSIAARSLRLAKVGSIEIGKIADIIVVEDNPLQDIRVLQNPENIKLVMKEGKICFIQK